MNLRRLVANYPGAFDLEHPKPLALGIHKQLAETFKPGCAYRLVGCYTKRRKYLQAVASPGSYRINLDGSVADPVSGEHAEYALNRLQNKKPVVGTKSNVTSARPILTLNRRTEIVR